MDERRHADELQELGKIDYFLDHLARAVERGDAPRSTYDILAPGYLARRGYLAAVITGTRVPIVVDPSRSEAHAPVTEGVPPTRPAGQPQVAPGGSSVVPAIARGVSKPVAWTTVLLFLGAFLVIVASAIFAVAVWDLLAVVGKLLFLGAVTAAFYGAGLWARRRLETQTGSVTLITVASALLLFDGWIAIDGYNLRGPLPWAALLLVCSAVYWYTEVRLAGRFFGAVGAAAQLGWWWLFGEGIGLPAPMRLAAMAVVVLGWSLAAERSSKAPALSSLSQVLEVAAPVAQVAIALAIVADLLVVGSAGPSEVAAAALAAAAGALTISRTRLIERAFRPFAAAAVQLPLALAVLVSVSSTGDAWGIAAVLALATCAYVAVGLAGGGALFHVLALVAELGLLLEVCALLGVDPPATAASAAVLATSWALVSSLAERLADSHSAPRGADSLAWLAEAGALLLLGGSSVVMFVLASDRLYDSAVSSTLGFVAVVLTAWVASAFIRRSGVFLVPAVVWSFFVAHVAAVLWLRDAEPAVRVGAISAIAVGWLVGSRFLERTFERFWPDVVRWVARAALLLAALAGVAWELLHLHSTVTTDAWGTWPAVGLAAATALVFGVESVLRRFPPGAAAAAGLAVLAGALAGGSVPYRYPEQFALAAGGAGLVTASVAAAVRRIAHSHARYMAVAAATAGSLAASAAIADAPALAATLALLALSWALATYSAGQGLATLAGIATVLAAGALARWLDAAPFVTVLMVGGVSLAFCSATILRPAADGGRFRVGGYGLAAAGLFGNLALLALAWGAALVPEAGEWWQVSGHSLALALVFLGASLLLVSWRYRLEAGRYAGWAMMLLALWSEFAEMDLETVELFSTSLALYLIAMGLLASRSHPERPYPTFLDAAAVIVGLGVPLRYSLVAYPASESLMHSIWAIALSLVAIGAGVLAKVRWYFFGGVAALAAIAFYRSFSTLVEVWWLVLFIVGVMLLVVALSWERQRVVARTVRERLKSSFEQWR